MSTVFMTLLSVFYTLMYYSVIRQGTPWIDKQSIATLMHRTTLKYPVTGVNMKLQGSDG